jgi:hypothetical protein
MKDEDPTAAIAKWHAAQERKEMADREANSASTNLRNATNALARALLPKDIQGRVKLPEDQQDNPIRVWTGQQFLTVTPRRGSRNDFDVMVAE